MRLVPILSFLLMSAAPAWAEPTGISGTLKLGQASQGEDRLFDIDTRTRFEIGGAALDGRLELGLSHDGDREAAYASAGLGLPFGAIDVGRPRTILESGPLPDPARFGSVALRDATRPLASEAALDDTVLGGVRVNGDAGDFRLGTSWHLTEEPLTGTMGDVIGLAGSYKRLSRGAVEHIVVYGGAETDGSEDRFRLGTEVAVARTTTTLDVLRGSDDGGFGIGQVSLGLALTEQMTLGISGAIPLDGGSEGRDARLGIGAEYRSENGAMVSGGIDGTRSGNFSFDVSVGFEF